MDRNYLKPCPHCKGKVELIELTFFGMMPIARFMCMKCYQYHLVMLDKYEVNKQDCIDAWNRQKL